MTKAAVDRTGLASQKCQSLPLSHLNIYIGGHLEGVVIRSVARRSELSAYPQICQQVQALTEAGWAAIAIGQALSDAGYRSPRANACLRAQKIRGLQGPLGIRAPHRRVRPRDGLLPDEWWPAELVCALEIPRARKALATSW